MEMRNFMGINELEKLRNEYLNDTSLSEEERRIALIVLDTEINIQNSNHLIATNIIKINKLRYKIIGEAEKYLNSDEIVFPNGPYEEPIQFKDLAEDIIGNACYPRFISVEPLFFSNSYIGDAKIDNDTLNGSIPMYMDDKLEKNIQQVNGLGENTYRLNVTKYSNVEDSLSAIFPRKLLEAVYDEDGNFNLKQMCQNYASLESQITTLNVDSKIKGILRNVITNQRKYLTSSDYQVIPLEDIDYDLLKSENMSNKK